jgi:hypothetical protein
MTNSSHPQSGTSFKTNPREQQTTTASAFPKSKALSTATPNSSKSTLECSSHRFWTGIARLPVTWRSVRATRTLLLTTSTVTRRMESSTSLPWTLPLPVAIRRQSSPSGSRTHPSSRIRPSLKISFKSKLKLRSRFRRCNKKNTSLLRTLKLSKESMSSKRMSLLNCRKRLVCLHASTLRSKAFSKSLLSSSIATGSSALLRRPFLRKTAVMKSAIPFRSKEQF